MKHFDRSILLWGFAALCCIILLSVPAYAASGGPGASLADGSSDGGGGIIYQGDSRNGAGTVDAALEGNGVITDSPEALAAVEEARAAEEAAEAAGETSGATTREGEVFIHDGVRYQKGNYAGNFRLTGYDGENGDMTYSGKHARTGHTIAADRTILPIGTVLIIEGTSGTNVHDYDGVYVVEDIGGSVKGNLLDLYMGTREAAALVTHHGWQYSDVWIAVPASE